MQCQVLEICWERGRGIEGKKQRRRLKGAAEGEKESKSSRSRGYSNIRAMMEEEEYARPSCRRRVRDAAANTDSKIIMADTLRRPRESWPQRRHRPRRNTLRAPGRRPAHVTMITSSRGSGEHCTCRDETRTDTGTRPSPRPGHLLVGPSFLFLLRVSPDPPLFLLPPVKLKDYRVRKILH